MRFLFSIFSLVALLFASTSWAQDNETLVLKIDLPQGFVQGGMVDNEHVSGAMFIPGGENAKDWTEMITALTMHAQLNPKEYYDSLAAAYPKICENYSINAPVQAETNGMHIVRGAMSCGKVKGKTYGKFSNFYVVSKDDKTYMLERAARLPAFEAAPGFFPIDKASGTRWAKFFQKAALCNPATKQCDRI